MIKKIERKTGIYKIWFALFNRRYFLDKIDVGQCKNELEKYCPNTKSSCIHEYEMNKTRKMVSIIVPAYNAQNYIRKCVNSLIEQDTTYKYEIIVVNDGSKDKTQEIIKSIQCDFLKVIDKPNEGISSARNLGIKNACGKYIIFCDADDYMDKKAIQRLVDTAESTKSDIVEGAYQYILENGQKRQIVKHKKFERSEAVKTFGVPWCKCIKRSLFQDICFPQYWFEDSIIHQIVLARAKKITWIDDVVYYYRLNYSGATSAFIGNSRSVESLWISISLFNDRNKLCIPKTLDYYKYMLNMMRLGFHRTERLPEDIRKDFYYIYASFINENFDRYKFKICDLDYINLQNLAININYIKYCKYMNNT